MGIGIGVMVELCQCVLDGNRMPFEWAVSVMISIFNILHDYSIK